ncbi:DUF2489 domain-containing protein [Pokkaliibacter sp. CJK22405]|uniref:DUF2489 domain-containing protein n=1 Tax=Pokkaliibacter sp. CJK22405 TaxID=3384615 RepID=UPI003984AA6F
MTITLLLVGLVAIALLTPLAIRLWREDRERSAQNRHAEETLRELEQQRQQHIQESVRVITSAMKDGQCELTEGCIRLKGLLDTTYPGMLERQELKVLEEVWTRTEHIPRKEAFTELDLKHRRRHWADMDAMEEELRPAIERAISYLQKEASFQMRQAPR